jgi:hypothetical protein
MKIFLPNRCSTEWFALPYTLAFPHDVSCSRWTHHFVFEYWENTKAHTDVASIVAAVVACLSLMLFTVVLLR